MQLVNVLKTCPQLIKLVSLNGLQAPVGGQHDGIDEPNAIDDAYIADMVEYVMEGMHSDGKPTDPPPISLSRLRYAEFSGYGPYVYLVLRRLQTPSNAIFDIEYPNDPEGIRDVMSGVRTQLASLPVLILTAIDEWPHGVELYFTKVLATVPKGTRYAGRGGVSLKTLIKPEHTPEILDAHPIPSAVQTLAFVGHEDMSVIRDPRGLLRPLRRYSTVTTIYAQENAGGLFGALAEDLGEAEDFIFPGLQNIIVHHPEEDYPLGCVWWQELVVYLRARKTAGCAVRRLTVKGNLCHLYGKRGEDDQELTLETEREFVEEIVDERDDVCRCSN
ncbi:hypothetical protein PENSPDRAFT_656755 [Peniophora sp. CONT]|nr:hypothetical protein PENSPDRAFT_656755 [Peniophora sp. CONT]